MYFLTTWRKWPSGTCRLTGQMAIDTFIAMTALPPHPPHVPRWRLLTAWLFLFLMALAIDQIWVHLWRIVPIGYATTRLTEPISSNGGINYVRALNQLACKGVTGSNNAAVLLIRAVGPGQFPERTWYGKNILRQLDMPPFAPSASRLISLSDWIEKHPLPANSSRDARRRMELRLGSEPWTATNYPVIAQWIRANNRPLLLLAQATRRPRYYVPLESPDHGLVHARVPLLRPLTRLTSVAAMRGMLRLGQGNIAGATRWANRIHRLAVLVMQAPDVVSYLVGLRFENIAMRMLQAVANSGRLSVKQLDALSHSVESLAELPPLTEALNDQRYTGLSMLMMLDQNGLMILRIHHVSRTEKEFVNAIFPIDYAAMMRRENRIFDKEVAAAKRTDFLEECRERQRLKNVINGYASPLRVALNPADIAVVLANPAAVHIASYRRGAAVIRCLTEVAIALAQFKLVHGSYPAALADLVPGELKSPPIDAFSGGPFQYAVTSDRRGFRVKSHGPPPGVGGWRLNADMAPFITARGGNWPAAQR